MVFRGVFPTSFEASFPNLSEICRGAFRCLSEICRSVFRRLSTNLERVFPRLSIGLSRVFRKSRNRLSEICRNISCRLSTEKGGFSGFSGVFPRLSTISGNISDRLSQRLSRSFASMSARLEASFGRFSARLSPSFRRSLSRLSACLSKIFQEGERRWHTEKSALWSSAGTSSGGRSASCSTEKRSNAEEAQETVLLPRLSEPHRRTVLRGTQDAGTAAV